ncbi:MAG: class I SAM-dependent methyltransferase [Anaerolineales bacterium]|nr:MAG: class I SAM-dependent methyltransferase [Anaerolineales bacterium]
MRIGDVLKQLGSEGIEGLFARRYAEFARSAASMSRYRQAAADVAERVQAGRILEVGPGPGYIAIEIAKLLPQAEVVGLDISQTMVEIATRNAGEAGVADRVTFRLGNGASVPFSPGSFDFVVSNGSLHEWKEPVAIFSAIYDVLKAGGQALIGDLRRDASKESKDEIAREIDSRLMRWGLRHSFAESHTRREIMNLLAETPFSEYRVDEGPVALSIHLRKNTLPSE